MLFLLPEGRFLWNLRISWWQTQFLFIWKWLYSWSSFLKHHCSRFNILGWQLLFLSYSFNNIEDIILLLCGFCCVVNKSGFCFSEGPFFFFPLRLILRFFTFVFCFLYFRSMWISFYLSFLGVIQFVKSVDWVIFFLSEFQKILSYSLLSWDSAQMHVIPSHLPPCFLSSFCIFLPSTILWYILCASLWSTSSWCNLPLNSSNEFFTVIVLLISRKSTGLLFKSGTVGPFTY